MTVFDPSHGQWGLYPYQSKPAIGPWSTGQAVGYCAGVLLLKAGQTNVYCAPNWGPWNYDYQMYIASITLQHWYGIPETGSWDNNNWPWLDYTATH